VSVAADQWSRHTVLTQPGPQVCELVGKVLTEVAASEEDLVGSFRFSSPYSKADGIVDSITRLDGCAGGLR
jgi:hypothetical protein